MKFTFNPFTENLDALTSKITELSDVDTQTDAPAKNETLKWNGTKWVPATYDYNFTFSIAGFSDGLSTTYLIGSGLWQSQDSLSFTATYNNGPPTIADVKLSINGAGYSAIGSMNSPDYLTGTNYSGINFPAAKDQYLRFQLSGTDGVDTSTSTESQIYFRNYVFYGVANKNSGFDEADIEGFSSQLTNSYTTSRSLNATTGSYLVIAYPSSYTTIHATGFKFNSITCPFETAETVSITNGSSYTENYRVHASTQSSLGNSTLQLSTSSTLINPLYYGVTTSTDSFTEGDIEGLTNSSITNDNTQTWNSVTADPGEYLLFAFPTRLGIPTFYVGGFEGGFESPETVSVTNVNGYTEDYYAWRSTNAGLGATTVQTQ